MQNNSPSQKGISYGDSSLFGQSQSSPSAVANTSQKAIIDRIAEWINGVDTSKQQALLEWLFRNSESKSQPDGPTPASSKPNEETPTKPAPISKYWIPRLAYELAMRLPQQFCEQLLEYSKDPRYQDPRILDHSFDTQFSMLVAQPLGRR